MQMTKEEFEVKRREGQIKAQNLMEMIRKGMTDEEISTSLGIGLSPVKSARAFLGFYVGKHKTPLGDWREINTSGVYVPTWAITQGNASEFRVTRVEGKNNAFLVELRE